MLVKAYARGLGDHTAHTPEVIGQGAAELLFQRLLIGDIPGRRKYPPQPAIRASSAVSRAFVSPFSDAICDSSSATRWPLTSLWLISC